MEFLTERRLLILSVMVNMFLSVVILISIHRDRSQKTRPLVVSKMETQSVANIPLIRNAYKFGYFQGAQQSALGRNAGLTFSPDSSKFESRFIHPIINVNVRVGLSNYKNNLQQ